MSEQDGAAASGPSPTHDRGHPRPSGRGLVPSGRASDQIEPESPLGGAATPTAPQPAPHPAPQPAGLADGGWHRVHPLTPAIRSWQIVVVILFFIVQNFGTDAAQGQFPDFDRPSLAGRELAEGGAVIVFAVLVIIGVAHLSWRMTRFRVTEDALELHTGVLFRQQRRARLDRVQAVDVVQPLIARLVGLAKITLEVAGGSGSAVSLQYLTERQAESLRAHLLARAAGVRYETQEAPEAPERPVFALQVPRLVLSLVFSGAAVALVVGVVGFVGAAVLARNPAPAFGALPTLLGVGSVLWARFNSGFGFEVATSPDGIRLRHGLLEQRRQTVPPGRVQAVRLRQPLLWRPADWWAVEVNIAGYGDSSGAADGGSGVLLPVGTRAEAMTVMALVFPHLGVGDDESPHEVVDAGLVGIGPAHGYRSVPRRARWLDPVSYRRMGFRVTHEALLIRQGRLWRRLDAVPHARSQSWGLTQGPLQRRLGLASFALHSTPGPVVPKVWHLDAAAAGELLSEQAVRARRARAAAGPERWMEATASHPAQANPMPSEQPPGEGSADSSPG